MGGTSLTRLGIINRYLERLPLLQQRRALAYALALALSAVGWAMRWQLDDVFPPGFPFVTFFPVVIVTAFLFGVGPGTLAGFACGVAAWYSFIAPAHDFAVDRGSVVAMVFYAAVVTVDILLIHWMQRANARMLAERERSQALASRSELLFRELQHRVANNIQMVGAVLALHMRHVADEEARQALSDASTKLQMIGRIHRQLYDPNGTPLALDVFLTELAADLVSAGGKPGIRHSIDADPGVILPPTAAIPVALVLAEGIANAMEHGFADREQGHIHIGINRGDAHVELIVTDDGDGLPDGFDGQASTSLGLRIARTLAQQLKGRFALERHDKGGTRLRLTVPIATAA